MQLRRLLVVTAVVMAYLFNPVHALIATEQLIDIKKESLIEQVIVRGSLDVGSGETKMTVASVNTETNQIEKILYQKYLVVELRKDLGSSTDGCLSEKIEKKLINTIRAMQEDVKPFGPQEWVGVGTSVFRTAKNSQEFLNRVEAATGISIRIIPQIEEGEIGFASAAGASREAPEEIVAWDSGSGSFQICSLINGKLEMYGDEFAFVPALEALFKNRNQPFSSDISPNPVSRTEALKLIETIRTKLPPLPSWIVENNKKVVSIGGEKICIFSIGTIATGQSTLTKEQVMQAILQHCDKNDDELSRFAHPKKVVVSLVLLYTVMDHCGFEKVLYFPTNGGCEGILITPRFWVK